jgi:signal transduction histidine kinase
VAATPVGPARWLGVPVVVDGATRGHVVVAQFEGDQRAEIDSTVRVMLLALLLVIGVVAAGGYLAMGRALRPLRAVTEAARTIEETDLSRRIEVTGSDEVARLGRTFNAMVERLERAFANQQAFLSDVGHELRTPLTIIRGHLEVMGDGPAERRETVALVTDELDRMNRMVNDLLELARAEQPDFLRPEEVDVAAMMAEIHAKAAALGPRDWRLGEIPPVTVPADRQRLTQALMQLVQNAVQFTGEGDRIDLAATADGRAVRLSVSDTGVGIDPADRELIFKRFGRTGPGRERADGTGLGLAIVAAVAHAHRGSVTVDSIPGEGSTFTLVIPRGQA